VDRGAIAHVGTSIAVGAGVSTHRSFANALWLGLVFAACGGGATATPDAGSSVGADRSAPADATAEVDAAEVDAVAQDAGAPDAEGAPDAHSPDASAPAPLDIAAVPTRSVRAARMGTARDGHTATLLPDGRVVVIGGERIQPRRDMLASVEIYDPATDTWSPSTALPESRANHTATLLDDGTILVIGGGRHNAIGVPSGLDVRATALVYDPSTGASVSLGPTRVPRHGHQAVRLPSGRILVVGGSDNNSEIMPAQGAQNPQPFGRALASAELFDPATRAFSDTSSMSAGRFAFTAVLLADGRVMVSGGANYESEAQSLATSELYDEATGRFTPTADFAGVDRLHHAATRLSDGRVLVFGGKRANIAFLADAQVWSPETGLFTRVANLPPARTIPVVLPLPEGAALVAGGYACTRSGCAPVNTTTILQADGTTAEGPALNQARALPSVTVLRDGRVLIAGGYGFDSMTDVEILSP
jgi:hypothetical protein